MIPIAEQDKWNPYLETLDSVSLKTLQLQRFKESVEYAYRNSRMYRKLYEDHQFDPQQIKTFEDIPKVPFTTKKLFNDDLNNPGFYGDSLSVDQKEVVYFHQTSGTTHKPLYQPDTLGDWYWWAECWAQLLWAQGVRPADKVFLPFNYNLFIAFWGAHFGCEKIGTEIYSAGGMSTKERILKIVELKPTVLITTPTYSFRMVETAALDLNMDLKTTSIKKIICAGEPGALIPAVKQKLEQAWDADVYDHVGATEVGAWGFECKEKPGGLHINESMFLVELIDIETGEMITEPNRYGKIVITSFHRKGRPCIRFDTQDIGCYQENECNCGRTFRLLKGGVIGRCDHLFKIRGTFITPAVIENIILEHELTGNEFCIIVGKEDDQSLEVEVELRKEISRSSRPHIAKALQEEIHLKTQLKFKISLKKPGELTRSEVKSKRLLDLRKKTDQSDPGRN